MGARQVRPVRAQPELLGQEGRRRRGRSSSTSRARTRWSRRSRRGEVDYVRGVGADQFDALANEPNIKPVEGFANGYTYLSFNTKGNTEGYGGSTSALIDPAFRDALGYAIDNAKLVDATLAGHGVPGTTNVPPYHANWHVEPTTPRRFDIAEADRRLDAAGYDARRRRQARSTRTASRSTCG